MKGTYVCCGLPVIYGLLQTLCWVASWDEGAGCPGAVALLDPGGLGEGLVVGVHPVHDDPPLTLGVHSPAHSQTQFIHFP